jgi:hypothetical protein
LLLYGLICAFRKTQQYCQYAAISTKCGSASDDKYPSAECPLNSLRSITRNKNPRLPLEGADSQENFLSFSYAAKKEETLGGLAAKALEWAQMVLARMV